MQFHIGSPVITKVSLISKLPYGHPGSFAATVSVKQWASLLHSHHACPPLQATRSITHKPVPVSAQAELALRRSAEWPWLCPQCTLLPGHRTALYRSLHTEQSQSQPAPDQQKQSSPGIKAQVPKPFTSVRQRTVGYLRESLLLSYTALFDNVIFSVFEWLQLDKVLKWLTPKVEDGYAALTGVTCTAERWWHTVYFLYKLTWFLQYSLSCRQLVYTSRWPAQIHIPGESHSI